ncbi:MAG: phosphatase PAP2 family protein [Bacteroidota bacterium]
MKGFIYYVLFFYWLLTIGKTFGQDTTHSEVSIRKYIAPVVLITYGVWCTGDKGFPSSKRVQNFRSENFAGFNTSIDDYLVFAPAAGVYALDLFNVKSAHDPLNQTILFAKTSALTLITVYGLKYLAKEHRPDGSNDYSFPSSHTAFAFAYATVLHEEFKDESVWVSVAGYSAATAVGTLRIANNEHWFNDVLVGAGIGILSTKLVYLTHQHKYKSNWPKKSALLPNIGNRYYGVMWQHTF